MTASPAVDPRLAILGATIRALRVDQLESQDAAAAACGIKSRPYWTAVENGQVNISMGKLLAIADHFGVTMAQLCDSIPRSPDEKLEARINQ